MATTAPARIDLKGSVTHTAPASFGGRTLKRGSPIVITDPAHIQYYKDQGGISVTYLPKAKAHKAPEPETAEPEGDDGMTPKRQSKADLNKLNKAALLEHAALLGLDGLDGKTNAVLVDAILKAQDELLDGDEGGE